MYKINITGVWKMVVPQFEFYFLSKNLVTIYSFNLR
jgi:hypothetical protein